MDGFNSFAMTKNGSTFLNNISRIAKAVEKIADNMNSTKKLYIVEGSKGTELEGTIFAICDSREKAEKALKMLPEKFKFDCVAHKSKLPLNTIITDDIVKEVE